MREYEKANHLYHNNYILTSVHFRNEDTFLKLCLKHNKMADDGTKVLLFKSPQEGGIDDSSLNHLTPLNELNKDLVEATKITMIRPSEQGIPGVVRETTLRDEYGGLQMCPDSKGSDKFNFESEANFEEDKKPLMEAREIEYRQELNVEELQRIGMFIHAITKRHKKTELRMKELHHELEFVEENLKEYKNKLDEISAE